MDYKNYINKWICITDDGIWESTIEDKISWDKKKDLLCDTSSAREDSSKRLKVKKIDVGHYIYSPKDCDGIRHYGEFTLVRITQENIDRYKELIDNYFDELADD